MDREIEIPKCVNYADLRKKKEVPAIEADAIRTYARNLSAEGMKIFLAEVKDEDLITETHIRLFNRKNKIEDIKRLINDL